MNANPHQTLRGKDLKADRLFPSKALEVRSMVTASFGSKSRLSISCGNGCEHRRAAPSMHLELYGGIHESCAGPTMTPVLYAEVPPTRSDDVPS
jgi:hypothetical protein